MKLIGPNLQDEFPSGELAGQGVLVTTDHAHILDRAGGADFFKSSPRQLAMTAIKMAVSLGLIWYLFSRFAPGLSRFVAIDLRWCSLAFVALLATLPASADRWRRILGHLGAKPTWSAVFQVFYTSVFFTQILPSIGGDVVRVLYHRTLGSGARALVISVLLDRGMGIAGLLALGLICFPPLSQVAGGAAIALPSGVFAASLLLAAYVGVLLLPVIKGSRLWQHLPLLIRTTLNAIAWALGSREGVLRLLPLSVMVHFFSVVAIYSVGRALHIPLSFWGALGVGPLILLAQVLPISIGGWGVRETAAVVFLTALGVDSESALALSIVFGALVVLVTLPGLLFWFVLRE